MRKSCYARALSACIKQTNTNYRFYLDFHPVKGHLIATVARARLPMTLLSFLPTETTLRFAKMIREVAIFVSYFSPSDHRRFAVDCSFLTFSRSLLPRRKSCEEIESGKRSRTLENVVAELLARFLSSTSTRSACALKQMPRATSSTIALRGISEKDR